MVGVVPSCPVEYPAACSVWCGMQNQNTKICRMKFRGQSLTSTRMSGPVNPPPHTPSPSALVNPIDPFHHSCRCIPKLRCLQLKPYTSSFVHHTEPRLTDGVPPTPGPCPEAPYCAASSPLGCLAVHALPVVCLFTPAGCGVSRAGGCLRSWAGTALRQAKGTTLQGTV